MAIVKGKSKSRVANGNGENHSHKLKCTVLCVMLTLSKRRRLCFDSEAGRVTLETRLESGSFINAEGGQASIQSINNIHKRRHKRH